MDWIAHVTEALNSMYRGAPSCLMRSWLLRVIPPPLGRRLLNVVCAGLECAML